MAIYCSTVKHICPAINESPGPAACEQAVCGTGQGCLGHGDSACTL